MSDRVIRIRLMTLVVLTAIAFLVWVPQFSESKVDTKNLTVKFLDVGQGDATLVVTPSGKQVLIDGGRDNGVLTELSKAMSFMDRSLDLVIATHPDSDHIGGLNDVFKRYQVANVLMTDNQSDSPAAQEYQRLLEKEGAEVMVAYRGQVVKLDASTTVEVLWPEGDAKLMESNTSSIVIKITYGETTFILTGDAPKNIEEYLVLAYGEHLKSDVLKVGHHGSRTSTSELFLAEVDPAYAVLSYGADNSYGHPHVEVTDALFNAGVETYSTAEVGTITFQSDAKRVWLE